MKRILLTSILLIQLTFSFAQGYSNCSNAVVIGTTTIIEQANRCNPGRLIYEWPDQTAAAVWMYSTSQFINHPDRGTGYNYFNGNSWDVLPTTRLELERTGYPNIIGGTGIEEIIFNHANNTLDTYELRRTTKGIGPWVQGTSPVVTSMYPRVARGGSNNQYLHLVECEYYPANGQEFPITYWRSPDMGLTWDIQAFIIPHLDSLNIRVISPDSKNIACRGNTVAIVVGGFTDDLILVKSIDNGLTWTKTIINQFPIPLYNELTMMTDANGDMIPDTIETTDQAASLIIDSNGIVHVWNGKIKVFDQDPWISIGYNFLDEGALCYWNENMNPNSILNNPIAYTEDLNNDGILNMTYNTMNDIYSGCRCSRISMPSAGINAADHLFVTYTSYVEDTLNPYPTPLRINQNVYLTISTDYGLTWSTPSRVCPDASVNQILPSMAEWIYNDPKIIFFQDTSNMSTPNHYVEVAFISPDVSTGILAQNSDQIEFSAWQSNDNLIHCQFTGITSTDEATISIFDLSGRKLYNFDLNERGIREKDFDTPALKSGIYLVTLNCNSMNQSVKLFYEE